MKSVSIVIREDAMVPFDRWLATALAKALGQSVPRGLTRRAIVGGQVAVGGRIVRDPGVVLRRGPSVFVRRLDWIPAITAANPLRVLYEDEWLIVVDKECGLPTHETKDPRRPSLTELVERHVGRRVFVHHRLDAGTSGVVLFAKAAAANPALAESFAEREVFKSYLAVVRRPAIEWPNHLDIDNPIEILKNGTVRSSSKGLAALTRVRVIDRHIDRMLVEAKPVTGRKHQIRVHLASMGAPILGDTRYGGPPAPRLMLHAEGLRLDHPVTRSPLAVVSPRPAGFVLSRVREALSRLAQPRPREAGRHSAREVHAKPRPDDPRPSQVSRKETRRRKPGPAARRGSRH